MIVTVYEERKIIKKKKKNWYFIEIYRKINNLICGVVILK